MKTHSERPIHYTLFDPDPDPHEGCGSVCGSRTFNKAKQSVPEGKNEI